MSVELKLLELGYKPLLMFPTHYYTKLVTKYTDICFEVENGQITKYGYRLLARMIPKHQTIIKITETQLQNDLKELKEYENI
jgi:hypothetical protein